MTRRQAEYEELLSTGEVALMFHVDVKTVIRWQQAGKLSCIRTLGGHRRFSAIQVRALLNRGQQ